MLLTLTRVARWSLGKAWFRAASSRRSSRLKTSWAKEAPAKATGQKDAPASRVAAPQLRAQITALGNSRPAGHPMPRRGPVCREAAGMDKFCILQVNMQDT